MRKCNGWNKVFVVVLSLLMVFSSTNTTLFALVDYASDNSSDVQAELMETAPAAEVAADEVTSEQQPVAEPSSEDETTSAQEDTSADVQQEHPAVEDAGALTAEEEPEKEAQDIRYEARINNLIKVVAVAKEGVLPEGAKLTVKELDSKAEVRETEEVLENNNVDYDGFLAFDVSFISDGREVEPDGKVEVKFEIDAAKLDENVDESSLEVQHFEENGNGVVTDVKTVADAEVKGGVVEAEFTTKSFSTYTLTWNYYSYGWKSANITFQLIDTEKKDIGTNSTGSSSNTIAFSSKAPAVQGYTFTKAVLASSEDDAVKAGTASYAYLTYNSSYKEWYVSNNAYSMSDWTEVGNKTVYLIYTKNQVVETTLYVVDGNGNKINGVEDIKVTTRDASNIDSYKPTVAGYTYSKAVVANDGKTAVGPAAQTYTRVKYENNKWQVKNGTGAGSWHELTAQEKIFLIYNKDIETRLAVIDDQGTAIHDEISVTNKSTAEIANYKPTVDGYTYSKAVVAANVTEAIKATAKSYKYVKYDSNKWKVSNNYSNNYKDIPENQQIFLIYAKNQPIETTIKVISNTGAKIADDVVVTEKAEKDITTYKPNVDGYTYVKAVVAGSANDAIKATATEYKKVKYDAGQKKWQVKQSGTGKQYVNIPDGQNIYLIYSQNVSTSLGVIDNTGKTLHDDVAVTTASQTTLSTVAPSVSGYDYAKAVVAAAAASAAAQTATYQYIKYENGWKVSNNGTSWTNVPDGQKVFLIYAKSSKHTNLGDVHHIDIKDSLTATVVIGGQAYNVDFGLKTTDSQYITVSAAYGDGTPVKYNWKSTSTDNDGGKRTQIRLQGDSSTYSYSTDKGNRWGTGSGFPIGTKADPVYYTVTIEKNITVYIQNGKATTTKPMGTYQQYDVPVTLTITLDYWDARNTCPELTSSNGGKINWANGEGKGFSGLDIEMSNGTGSIYGSLTVQKDVSGTVLSQDKTFRFVIRKDGEVYKNIELKVKAGESTAQTLLPLIPFGTYTVEEVSDSAQIEGYSVATTTEYFSGQTKVQILDIGNDNTIGTALVSNAYTNTQTSAAIEGNKVLSGKDLAANEFTFALYEGETATGTPIQTVKNKSNGTFTFGSINYNTPGTYKYTVKEVAGTETGVTYDNNSYRVDVNVTQGQDGKCHAEVQYPQGGLKVNNQYKPNVVIEGLKVLTGKELNARDYSFELYEGQTCIDTATNESDGSFSFAPIEYAAEGTHTYTVKEVIPSPAEEGMIYDETAYTVTVKVEMVDGQLQATATYPDNKDKVKFTNQFTTTAVIEGYKTLEGRKLTEGEFTFGLYKGETATGTPIQTKTNDADGNFAFDAIAYDEAGTYNYVVKEIAGDEAGITYDGTEYGVKVSVFMDEDGKLETEVSYTDGDKEAVDEIEFVNEFTPVQATIEGYKTLTGKDLAAGEFTFALYEGETVTEESEPIDTATNAANGKFKFEAQTYDKVGAYKYTVQEIAGSEHGVTYSTASFVVTVNVTKSNDGQLVATPVYPENYTFVNTYTPDKARLALEGEKILENRTLKANEFQFKVTENQGGEEKVVATGTNAANGDIVFTPEFEYDAAGTHTYTIAEVVPENPLLNVLYSDASFEVVVNVVDDGEGHLVATPTYPTGGVKFINTYVPGETDKTVTKVWEDEDNQDGLRPASIEVQLLADGEAYGDKVELNATNNWSYTWKKLPTDAEGEMITYTVEEIGTITGYTTGYSADTFTITNTHTPAVTSKTVTKVWDDNNDQDGLRDSYGVTLYKQIGNGEKTAVGDEVTLDKDTLTYTWDNLDEYANGQKITYTVKETTVPKEYKESYSEDGWTVTNKLIDAKIVVTKYVVNGSYEILAGTGTYYVGLFEDPRLEGTAIEFKPLVFNGTTSATASFDVPRNSSYYVVETDKWGNALRDMGSKDGAFFICFEKPSGIKDLDYWPDFKQVDTTNSPQTVDISNIYIDAPPPYFYKEGSVTVTKKVVNFNGTPMKVNDTFYVTVFTEGGKIAMVGEGDDLTPAIAEIKLNNASQSEKVVIDELAAGTYTIAETDKYGNKVDNSKFTPEFDRDTSFTVNDDTVDFEYTLTNRAPKEDEPPIDDDDDNDNGPKTGDDNSLMRYLAEMMTSILALGYVLIAGRKEEETE